MTERRIQKWNKFTWYSLCIVRHVLSDPMNKYRTSQTEIGSRRSLDHDLSFERCRIRFSSTYITTKCEFVANLYKHDPPSDTKYDRVMNLRSMYFGKIDLWINRHHFQSFPSVLGRRTYVCHQLDIPYLHHLSRYIVDMQFVTWTDGNATSIKTRVFPRWTWNATHPQRSKCLRVYQLIPKSSQHEEPTWT